MNLRSDVPRDCALTFAIPLSRNDFFADLEGRNGVEYARRFESQLAALSSDMLWARYEAAVVTPASEAIELACREGVHIEPRVTADRLRELLIDRHVVTLFAHWRQGGFTRDSIQDPDWSVAQIKASERPLGRELARLLPALASTDTERLAEFLNENLKTLLVVQQEEASGNGWIANDPQQNLDRNYEVFRAEFPDWGLLPVGIELADGVQTVSDLVRMFSPEYAGVFDLRMCNSVLPGEAIKRIAPRAQVLINRDLMTPEVQLVLYKNTILLLRSAVYDYVGAAMALRKAVVKRLT